jgi:hypothetical protein
MNVLQLFAPKFSCMAFIPKRMNPKCFARQSLSFFAPNFWLNFDKEIFNEQTIRLILKVFVMELSGSTFDVWPPVAKNIALLFRHYLASITEFC